MLDEKNKPALILKDPLGMPKRPISAYLMFAKDTRKLLKKKMGKCTVSDVMKAVSIDWVKLCTEEKYNYH